MESEQGLATVVLRGLRFHEPITQECPDIEAAVVHARSWEELRGALGVGWAYPLQIEDTAGNILLDESALTKAIWELGF